MVLKQVFWILFFFYSAAFGQEQFTVKGRVVDGNGRPVSIGDVLLFDSNKKNLVLYTTLDHGEFAFDQVTQGEYWLEVSALGYRAHAQKIDLRAQLELTMQLVEEVTELEGVEVTTLKNPITNINGNFGIDVQNPVFSSLVDPLEILKKLPNVQVSPDRESISIIAKGSPLIYLGKQRIDLEAFTALSVDAIEKIELIDHPSPKYEAEGRAVILVHLKQALDKGGTLDLGETLSIKRNVNNFLSSNGSYSNGKWNLRGTIDYNELGWWESHAFAFSIPKENIYSDYLVVVPRTKRKQIHSGLGFYHPFEGSDYISLNTTIKLQSDMGAIQTDTFLEQGNEQNRILTDSKNMDTRNYFSGNLNFNKKLNRAMSLFAGIQFSTFIQKLDTDISNNYNGAGFVMEQSRKQDYKIGSLAARLDFEYTFSDQLKGEFGTSWNEARARSHSEVRELDPWRETAVDHDTRELLFATYINLSSNLGDGLDLDIGARMEYNSVQGELKDETDPILKRRNTKFFPKAGLRFKIDSTKTLSLNYSRNITRPDFSRTSSVSVFINPFLEANNNINLLPTITNEATASLQWKSKSLTAGMYKREEAVYYTIGYGGSNEVAVLSPTNLDGESGFYVSATLPFSHKIWTSNNTLSLSYGKIGDAAAPSTRARPYLYAYTDQQLKVAKDTLVSFGGWWITERHEGVFERNGMLVLHASLTKTFFEKLQCTLRLNDITQAMNFEETYSFNGVEAHGTYFADAAEIALALKYRLGNPTAAKFRNRDVDENLDRID